jgi:hypothetical protein
MTVGLDRTETFRIKEQYRCSVITELSLMRHSSESDYRSVISFNSEVEKVKIMRYEVCDTRRLSE